MQSLARILLLIIFMQNPLCATKQMRNFKFAILHGNEANLEN
jgi:hypothetical protein